MTLHQLKVFARVAKLKSFTQAAKSLNVRQSSISLLIKSLEQEHKVKLFEKIGNKIHLSAAGKRLLTRTGEILSTVEKIKRDFKEIQDFNKGTLSIGGSAIAGATFLPAAVDKFKKRWPGIEIVLRLQTDDILEKKLSDGELDLAIMSGAPEAPLLVGELYHKEEIVAFAPPNHPLTKQRSVSLELLSKEPVILHKKDSPTRDMLDERFARRGLTLVPALEVDSFNSRDTIKRAVANGQGISFLSRCFVAVDAEAGRVKLLNVPDLKLQRTLYIVTHKKRRSLPLVQAFIESLR